MKTGKREKDEFRIIRSTNMKPKNLQNQKYEVVEMISKMRSRPEAAAIRDSPASWNEFERENQSTYHHRVDEHRRCWSVDRLAPARER